MKATPTVTETYVYDAFGKLAAEYSTTASTTGGTFYRTTDHLGSTRLVTKQDKSDADCYDYAPFGEEIPNTLGGRSSNACFAASFDGRQKFTGKERDDESDLDYFGARYFGSSIGRFTSPDAPFVDQEAENPQSWNLYSYARNNPLSLVDPSGRCVMPAEAPKGTSPNAICKDVDKLTTSAEGKSFIKKQEGLRLDVYVNKFKDPKTGEMVEDDPTVGYGHVVTGEDKDDIVDNKITPEQADQFFEQDIEQAERDVRSLVDKNQLPLSQDEFDALVDLAFNVGRTELNEDNSPGLNDAIGRRDYDEMSRQLMYSRGPGGGIVMHLVERSMHRAIRFRRGMGK